MGNSYEKLLLDEISNAEPAKKIYLFGVYIIFIAVACVVNSIFFQFNDGSFITFSIDHFINLHKNPPVLKMFLFIGIGCGCLVIQKFIKGSEWVVFRLIFRIVGFYFLTFYLLILGDFIVKPGILLGIAFVLFQGGISLLLAGRLGIPSSEPTSPTQLQNSKMIRVVVDNSNKKMPNNQ